MKRSLILTLSAALLSSASLSPALADDTANADDYFDLSLSELTNIEITSVSKRSEKASEVAAAVHVITQEDIRRSGATSIPEALRMAPGIQVQRVGSSNWSVSARGFNGAFANKLLVLIDGRSLYTPLFSGVFWDVQDTVMENIDRIEVIRGPGGTIWGANAVNGVINIITKTAEETQGGMARTLYGTHELNTALSAGGKTEKGNYYRGSLQYKKLQDFERQGANSANDEWDQYRAEGRVDSAINETDNVSIQMGGYFGSEDADLSVPTLTFPFSSLQQDEFNVSGGHAMAEWSRSVDSGDYAVKGYYDATHRDTFAFEDNTHTLDVDFNHMLKPEGAHQLVWGVGYRHIYTDVMSSPLVTFAGGDRSDDLFTAFIQDKIELVDNEAWFSIGSKFEHNDYTGFEWQPSARFSWVPDEQNTLWASVTRAVRTPSRADHDISVIARTAPTPQGAALLVQQGNDTTEAEELYAYELGYRISPIPSLSFDLSLFYNDYAQLMGDTIGNLAFGQNNLYGLYPFVPITVNDNADATTHGGEIAFNWQALPQWILSGYYSYLNLDYDGNSSFIPVDEASPTHQFSVRSQVDVTEHVQWDTSLYYTDDFAINATNRIDKLWKLDMRLGVALADNIMLDVVGQNLLDNQNGESGGFLYVPPAEVPRSGYVRLKYQW